MATATAERKTTKYRVISGQYHHQVTTDVKDAKGNIASYRNDEVVYAQGDTFETDRDDLHRRWPEKFQKLDDHNQVDQTAQAELASSPKRAITKEMDSSKTPFTPEELRKMDLGNLRNIAANLEINLGSAKTKEDLIGLILAAD